MEELNSERSKAWNMFMESHRSPPPSAGEPHGQWKSTSMSAISLGFLATAILISMFLIMAIFEHLFRPNAPFPLPHHHATHRPHDQRPMGKLVISQPPVQVGYAMDLSVLMPGHQLPTYIAHPTPLPCTREGVFWPSHHQHYNNVAIV